MATSRISLKTIDYFKYRNLIIDRAGATTSTEDFDRCGRDVQVLCDAVRRLHLRDDTFDEAAADRDRLDEICGCYKLILEGRRVLPVDVRLKSGWWGADRNAYSAGKLRSAAIREVLVEKTRDWMARRGAPTVGSTGCRDGTQELEEQIEGPGVYVFRHRMRRCFQYVGRTDRVFASVSENLKASFEGAIPEPLSALFVTSLANAWDFYFLPVANRGK